LTTRVVRGALAAAILAALGVMARRPAGGATPPLFRDVAQESGLRFVHFTGSTGEYFMPEIMGAGGALFDYDGDGDLDVLLLQGTMLDESKTPAQAPRLASRRARGSSATTACAGRTGAIDCDSPT